MLTLKTITEIIENNFEFSGCANSCIEYVSSRSWLTMKLPMILIWRGTPVPVAPLSKGQGQCVRHAPVLRRPWLQRIWTSQINRSQFASLPSIFRISRNLTFILPFNTYRTNEMCCWNVEYHWGRPPWLTKDGISWFLPIFSLWQLRKSRGSSHWRLLSCSVQNLSVAPFY